MKKDQANLVLFESLTSLEERSGLGESATGLSEGATTGHTAAESTGEAAAESAGAAGSTEATGHAAHLVHQFVHFAHQLLHLAGHLALLEAGLEGVLRSTLLAREAGSAEVAGQSVTVGAEVAGLCERSKSAGSTSLCEGAVGACKSLSSATGETTQAAGQRQCDADRGSGLLVLINFINSTHCKVLTFEMSCKDSIDIRAYRPACICGHVVKFVTNFAR